MINVEMVFYPSYYLCGNLNNDINNMNKQICILLCLIVISISSNAQQEWSAQQKQLIKNFTEHVKNNNVDALKAFVTYPLKREHPLDDIENAESFAKRYHEIFDEAFTSRIVNASIETNWSLMGAKGIMFDSGMLWLDADGRIIAVNYQSEYEKNKIKQLNEQEKEQLHESIKDYRKAIYLLKTKKFKVRIDQLDDDTYRYASWSADSEMTSQPDLVLSNGEVRYDGSGGNHAYRFKNGIYTYEVYVYAIGGDVPAELNVYKYDDQIVNQPAISEQDNLSVDARHFLLQEGQAGIFKVDQAIPFDQAVSLSFDISQAKEMKSTPDGMIEEPYYQVFIQEEELIRIKPAYNYETESYSKQIGEMLILSDRYVTNKQVGVGTTIYTFTQKYPNYKLWYTYVSDMYVIQFDDSKLQFLLDSNDFIGQLSFDSDYTELSIDDFREGAEVKAVRVY